MPLMPFLQNSMWSLPLFVKIAVTTVVREHMRTAIAPFKWVEDGKNVLKREDAVSLMDFILEVRFPTHRFTLVSMSMTFFCL